MLFNFGVFEIGIKDIVDILLVGIMLYWAFRLLKRSGAVNIFWGILMILVIWFFVCFVFDLELTGAIFNYIISIGAIALIVISPYLSSPVMTYSMSFRERESVEASASYVHPSPDLERPAVMPTPLTHTTSLSSVQ